jgi:hypothetical protein
MIVTLPRADIPIDSAGNVASRDLYRWMSDITSRVGGSTGTSDTGSLQQAIAMTALRRNIPAPPEPVIDLRRVVQSPVRPVNDSESLIASMHRTETPKPIDEAGNVIASSVFRSR